MKVGKLSGWILMRRLLSLHQTRTNNNTDLLFYLPLSQRKNNFHQNLIAFRWLQIFSFIKNAALTNQVKPLSPFIWINYFIDGTERFPNACRNAVLQWVTAHSLCYSTSFLLCCSSCLLQNPWKEVTMHCCLDWTWMTVTQTLYIHTQGPALCVCFL